MQKQRTPFGGRPPDVSIDLRVDHICFIDFRHADGVIQPGESAVESNAGGNDAIAMFRPIHFRPGRLTSNQVLESRK